MPKKMRTTRNLLLMATLLGSALFARAAEKEMTIGAIYLDTQGYYAGVRQGVQDAAKDSSVQVQLIETNAQGDISKESTFVDTLVARNVDAGNDSNLLIVFYVQIMPDDFVMQLHRF
ncbi:hypothetical protein QMY53_03304 [Escherichia coli TW14425]|nr:hypothetical protein QMY53_03304 [Escherichia coli TW14425]